MRQLMHTRVQKPQNTVYRCGGPEAILLCSCPHPLLSRPTSFVSVHNKNPVLDPNPTSWMMGNGALGRIQVEDRPKSKQNVVGLFHNVCTLRTRCAEINASFASSKLYVLKKIELLLRSKSLCLRNSNFCEVTTRCAGENQDFCEVTTRCAGQTGLFHKTCLFVRLQRGLLPLRQIYYVEAPSQLHIWTKGIRTSHGIV